MNLTSITLKMMKINVEVVHVVVIIITAVIAVCSAAKLDRSYLPPASAKTAGGTSEILQTPKGSTFLPVGSYENEHQGVVVDAALNTRASNIVQSGLGAPRITYGSTDSRVGEAAFRDKHLQGAPSFLPPGFDGFVQRPERIQANRDRLSNTIRLENNIGPNMYNYLFETENGIRAGQKAVSVNGIRAEGGYSYTGDDGLVYTVTYTADEDGYQPKGSHLPTPPPIPVEILKALEQNAKDEAAGVVDDGSYDAKKYNSEGDYSDNGDNDKYNDRQSNTFANRPEFDAQSSGSFNQNQALSPNANDQSGFVGNFKDQPSQFNIQTPDAAAGFSGNQPNEASNQGFIAHPSSSNSPTSDRFGQSSKPEQKARNTCPRIINRLVSKV
ncbi:unnamed protein product [Leptosia nina]|uniref:Uncharacterized protein n=1 Tax=Leptosia nina TaxID=320188 RepID=A0AAV1JP62_9NEOP